MAVAIDARPEETAELFHRAGHGFLYRTLTALGPALEELEDDLSDL